MREEMEWNDKRWVGTGIERVKKKDPFYLKEE